MQVETVSLGDYLIPDGWKGMGGLLQPGDVPVDTSYHGSQYRIDSNQGYGCYPVNITISGRQLNWTRSCNFGVPAIRVKIEWVHHDGEPNTISHGWLILNSY